MRAALQAFACSLLHQLNRQTGLSSHPPFVACCYRIWVSYLNPIFWTVYGLIESQVYNLSTTITLNSGEAVPAYEAVLQIFGYQ